MTVDLEAILARWSGDLNDAFEDVREMAREIDVLRAGYNEVIGHIFSAFDATPDVEQFSHAGPGGEWTPKAVRRFLDGQHRAAVAAFRSVKDNNERLYDKLLAAERELERWRHGVPIEGDYVCPYQLALTEVEWSGWTYPGEQPCCPSCRVLKSDGEHKDGCPFTVIRPNGGEGEQRNSSN